MCVGGGGGVGEGDIKLSITCLMTVGHIIVITIFYVCRTYTWKYHVKYL